MARVALVSHDVQTVLGGRAGGVGAFVTHFAGLLRDHGEDVTIVLTRQEAFPVTVDPEWRERYRQRGIELIELHNNPPSAERWSDAWPLRLSEQIAPLLDGFDIAYFQDWANVGFQAVRERRFNTATQPVLVTVLHGPSGWIRVGNQQYANLPEDLHVEYIERYSARHSDYVIAPSNYILDWVRQRGWGFDHAPRVLGLPYRAGPDEASAPPEAAAFRRLVFFGRLEARKGFGLFADALRLIPDALRNLEEFVFLGHEDLPGAVEQISRDLAGADLAVRHIGNLDSQGARAYLAERAADSLVVIPSPVENFPYAVIETSLIPGLNMICSRGGGIPEVLGSQDSVQLFDPHPLALAERLRERLREPLFPNRLAAYDYVAANQRWLDFHDAAVQPRSRQAVSVDLPAHGKPTVDVCVTYYNKHRHFPQLLAALDRQTVRDFGVIAVDDGSSLAEARALFDEMAERYRQRDWAFFRQPNAYVDAARNAVARRAKADYLLFIDADDVPAPNTVERMLEAALLSGDDCILTGGQLFEGDGAPEAFQARYIPLGPSLVSGLLDPIVFGLPMILIRREVFETLGGYRELRGVAHEDWELQARLLMAGYTSDVLPECLLSFRRSEDGLANSSVDFTAKRRLIDTYDQQLKQAGLSGAADAMYALSRRCRQLEEELRKPAAPEAEARLRQRVMQTLAKHGRQPGKNR